MRCLAFVMLATLWAISGCDYAEDEAQDPGQTDVYTEQPAKDAFATVDRSQEESVSAVATSMPAVDEVFSILPSAEDVPSGFVRVTEPHSVIAPEGPAGPPNARVLYELPQEPTDVSTISCLEFVVSGFPNESEAEDAFIHTKDTYTRPVEGATVAVLSNSNIGDESVGSTLLSTVREIGTCGSRPVHAYAAVAFRRDSVIATVVGFAPREIPNPEVALSMAEVLVARIDSVTLRK